MTKKRAHPQEEAGDEILEQLSELGDENSGASEALAALTAENETLKSALEAAEQKVNEASDSWKRSVAEFDNFKRRTQREKESLWTEAQGDVVKAFLPLMDNFERAMDALAADDASVASIREGIGLVFKQAVTSFEKLGAEAFGLAGEAFDPNIHNAVMHIEDDAFGAGVIVEVFQKGYKIGDRVIRHAMVKVAN